VEIMARTSAPKKTPSKRRSHSTGLLRTDEDLARLRKLREQYPIVDLRADLSALKPGDRKALRSLIQAAQIVDSLFLRQVWAGNERLLFELSCDESPLGRLRLWYFRYQKGPWDRHRNNEPFVPLVPPKPPQANFYPAGASRDEVERWFSSLSTSDRESATGFYTTIRRLPNGELTSIPYSVEYQNELETMSGLLESAAEAVSEPSLQQYLKTRAHSFRANDYGGSEVAWLKIDSAIEPTIGPHYGYEDGWFNFKTAFLAVVAIRDDLWSSRLQQIGAHAQRLENALPIPPALRNPSIGPLAPIRVANLIRSAGFADCGLKPLGFALPDDERIAREHGAKCTLLRNVQEATFEAVLRPIAREVLAADDQVDFETFFTFILMHEVMHCLGPQLAHVAGSEVPVRSALKEVQCEIEEAKADISGLWAMHRLLQDGVFPAVMRKKIFWTFIVAALRMLRFGTAGAHGKAMALQINYLLNRGAITLGKRGRILVDEPKFVGALESLTRDILMIQATGNYDEARRLLSELATVRPTMQRVLDQIQHLPVDIDFRTVTAQELLQG
jgi:hypothetical protein